MSLKLDFIHVRAESCNRDILLHPTELDLNQNPWRRSSGRVPRLFFRFQSQQIVKVWPPGKLRNHIQQQYPNLKKKKITPGSRAQCKTLIYKFSGCSFITRIYWKNSKAIINLQTCFALHSSCTQLYRENINRKTGVHCRPRKLQCALLSPCQNPTSQFIYSAMIILLITGCSVLLNMNYYY